MCQSAFFLCVMYCNMCLHTVQYVYMIICAVLYSWILSEKTGIFKEHFVTPSSIERLITKRLHTTATTLENLSTLMPHCKKDPVYVFLEMKLRSLVPPQFPHSCICDRYIYSCNRSTYFAAAK